MIKDDTYIFVQLTDEVNSFWIDILNCLEIVDDISEELLIQLALQVISHADNTILAIKIPLINPTPSL
jgi:hypothetical protein